MDSLRSMTDLGSLPIAEFGFPGPLRDQLVAAILDGSKTSTSSLVIEYVVENEPEPPIVQRQVVINSVGIAVAVIETTAVERMPLREVGLTHAIAEGEGYTSVAEWRACHEEYWHGAEMRAHLGDPQFGVDDSTEVILERFRVIERLGFPS
jgi:uncharacterized protein YhfF